MRLFVRIAVAILAVAVLALAAYLVPPHLQTRAIAPPLPAMPEMLALLGEPDGPVRVEYIEIASQDSPRGTIAHTVALVRWADGRAFMIDAGMDRTGAEEFARVLETLIGAGKGEFHGDVAEQLGPAVHDVRGVGFTHLHIDHTQGLDAFCAARGPGASVYWTRWQAEEHNFNTTESAAIVRDSCLEARLLEGEGLMPIAGFPGLGAIALGGHTPGSTGFVATLDGRLFVFSGDITNDKASILADAGKGFVYSYLLVPENTARTAELRRWLAGLDARDDTAVIVSHDAADAAASRLAAYARIE